MKKILFICIIVIVSIVIGDIFLQKKIDNTFDSIISRLWDIDNTISLEEKKTKIDELGTFFDDQCTMMACYIAHVELDKIKSQIVIVRAGIEVNDTQFVHEEINRTIYMIERIQDEEILKIDNIM